jgi:hypothetical protein
MKVALIEHVRWPFSTDLLYYPTGVNLYFHTLNTFNGLLTLPIQLAAGLLPAYNTVVLFSFAVGGYGAYLLALQALRGEWSGYADGSDDGGSVVPAPGAASRHAHLWEWAAAFVAGLVYTFAPFHFAHLLGHMQVVALQWIPFYLLYLLRCVETVHAPSGTGRRLWIPGRDVRIAAFFLVMVGLCDWYYVFYCLVFTAGLLVFMVLRRRLGWAAVVDVAYTWLLFALTLTPVLVPMIREALSFRFMVPDPAQTRSLSADLLAFVTPQEMHPLWGKKAAEWSTRFTSTTSERMVFAGYVPVLLALIAVLPRRLFGSRQRHVPTISGSTGLWTLSLLGFLLLSLGPVLHVAGQTTLLPGGGEIALPYALLHQLVPFVNISRSVSRFDVMVMLSLSILAALGLARTMNWLARAHWHVGGSRSWCGPRSTRNPGLPAAASGVAALLVLLEFLPAPYPMSPPDTPGWYFDLAAEDGDFAVLNLPMNWDRPGYLLYQTVHHKRLTAAYISREDPRTLVERLPVLQSFRHLGPDVIAQDLALTSSSVFDYLGVRYVVLDNYKMPTGGRERAETMRLASEVFGDAQPVWSDERLTVFRPAAASVSVPFLILGDGWGPRVEAGGDYWREILLGATLLIHSERTADLRLRFRVKADAQTDLTIWLGDAVVGGFTVDTASAEYESGKLTIAPGDTVLRLRTNAVGGRIRVSRLDVEDLTMSGRSTSH